MKSQRIFLLLDMDLLEESLAMTETYNVASFDKLQRPFEGVNTERTKKVIQFVFNVEINSQAYPFLKVID